MRLFLAVTLLAGAAHADSSVAGRPAARDPKLAAVEVTALPEVAALRLVLSLDQHHGCSLSYEAVQRRAELVLDIKGDRAELRVTGSERHVSGGRHGVSDGPPRVYRDETRPINGRFAGAVRRSGKTLEVAGVVPLTCRLERVPRADVEGETARALVCAIDAKKPLRLGTFPHPLPRLAFGRGDGFVTRLFARNGSAAEDDRVRVALASR